MAPPLLALRDIHLTFGGTPLLTGAEINVEAGDRICLVGRNGSGKSTLLKILAGLVEPDHGERFAHPNASVRYLQQEPDVSGFETSLEYVEAGLSPADDPFAARRMLESLGLQGDEHPAHLSGGESRRMALARVLAARPDVLLLDEPTNHLDLGAIEWLEATLGRTRSAIVLISHDRRLLENLSRATIWLDRGITNRIDRGFEHFEAWRDELLEQEEVAQHKLDRRIERENQWMHGGVTARRKRNVRRVRELQTMRSERREHRRVEGNVTLTATEGGASGRLVAELKGITKGYGSAPVVENFSTLILRGDRVGVIGPNGAGKTTILKLLTGELAPDSGQVRRGTNLEMVVLDQKRDELDPSWTVADALTGGRGDQVMVNGKARHVASYMKDFLFKPEQARSPLSVLSGGERARLMLARALAKPSNLLVLDEPTNDLDLETLDLLQELVADYTGTVLLVSHDRDFLDRVVTSVIASDGDGSWTEFAGGYTDMLAQRRNVPAAGELGAKRAKSSVDSQKPVPGLARTDVAATVTSPASAMAKRKLTFKEKHALETLPARIAALESEMKKLDAQLAAPNLYVTDRAAFDAATVRLTAAGGELADAEMQWLELEMLRESLATES
ncbi:MAG: elongation factor 3 [Hyphomicrobium sp.]|nr:MAG: elongation factor 3 [Hyphomicrobium sp.]